MANDAPSDSTGLISTIEFGSRCDAVVTAAMGIGIKYVTAKLARRLVAMAEYDLMVASKEWDEPSTLVRDGRVVLKAVVGVVVACSRAMGKTAELTDLTGENRSTVWRTSKPKRSTGLVRSAQARQLRWERWLEWSIRSSAESASPPPRHDESVEEDGSTSTPTQHAESAGEDGSLGSASPPTQHAESAGEDGSCTDPIPARILRPPPGADGPTLSTCSLRATYVTDAKPGASLNPSELMEGVEGHSGCAPQTTPLALGPRHCASACPVPGGQQPSARGAAPGEVEHPTIGEGEEFSSRSVRPHPPRSSEGGPSPGLHPLGSSE